MASTSLAPARATLSIVTHTTLPFSHQAARLRGGGFSLPSQRIIDCISNIHSDAFSSLEVLQGGSLASMQFRLRGVERGQRGKKRRRNKESRAGLGDIFHNQALISAFVASLSAQVLKPLASSATNKPVNWKLLFASGGMPSSHAAGIMAATTAIGLERGLSDSVFGLSAVVAGLTLYDAQGVRRAVGEHAQSINWILLNQTPEEVSSNAEIVVSARDSSDIADQKTAYGNTDFHKSPEDVSSGFMITNRGSRDAGLSTSKFSRIVSGSCHSNVAGTGHSSIPAKLLEAGETQMWEELEKRHIWHPTPLNESVGHTKLEVGIGALYGLIVALAIHTLQ